MQIQWPAFSDSTTIFNHSHLGSPSNDVDNKEGPIAKETFKNIELSSFYFSRVDLIKELKENEYLEYESIVQKFLSWCTKYEIFWQPKSFSF